MVRNLQEIIKFDIFNPMVDHIEALDIRQRHHHHRLPEALLRLGRSTVRTTSFVSSSRPRRDGAALAQRVQSAKTRGAQRGHGDYEYYGFSDEPLRLRVPRRGQGEELRNSAASPVVTAKGNDLYHYYGEQVPLSLLRRRPFVLRRSEVTFNHDVADNYNAHFV